MNHLTGKANGCEEKERDRRLKEQFINGIIDDNMTTEIIREPAVKKVNNEITSKQVLI